MKLFNRFSTWVTNAAGSPWAFCAALVIILFGNRLGWNVDKIATQTTFLLVFLIQHSQNRDGRAEQAKLNELVKAHENARNEMIGIEKMEETEIKKLEV